MSEEYEDRAKALLKGLKSNPKDDVEREGGSSESPEVGPDGVPVKKKKKKKLWLILVPLVLLLGVGGFVGLVFAGLVRNPPLEALLHIKRAAPAAKPTVEVAKVDPPVDTLPDLPKVGKKPKKNLGPVKDPHLGAQRMADIWNEMEPDAVVKKYADWKDPEIAAVLAEMDADKVAAILGAMDAKRSSKVSKLIQELASIPASVG